ncbi:taste receptor type 2 member 119-like [Cavia porcellus]|uniref:taste receptor type 2 member 119-like n=1 Tax=Cavia porcellus TaxID=10141 RepID=UPI002FDF93F2
MWLGVFYCTKITIIPQPLFFWLKMRISKLVAWLVLGSTLDRVSYEVFSSGFIVVVNVLDFIKQIQMAPLDLPIFCLVTSRICLQLFLFLAHKVPLSLMKQSEFAGLYVIFIFLNIWGLWLATWLGVFYCTKISTIQDSMFFWLKMRISKLVPWLILHSIFHASIKPWSILSFLTLYFSHYMMAILLFFHILQFGSFLFEFCILIIGTYPSVRSVVLILGHPKLQQNAKKFQLCGADSALPWGQNHEHKKPVFLGTPQSSGRRQEQPGQGRPGQQWYCSREMSCAIHLPSMPCAQELSVVVQSA